MQCLCVTALVPCKPGPGVLVETARHGSDVPHQKLGIQTLDRCVEWIILCNDVVNSTLHLNSMASNPYS
jgi:hypothetical protein